ncbi:hypothetical protein BME96_19050 (plasmid) [Virgibacillus halodenitrificans]|uniref:Uncharacterized protein n=1 Tax=Virgibacillus halodenitrificans TaxID=1482 RepID=A0AAC9J4Q1_VIRHA|nr:hypothetical protein [Virgibacillus halodenitrificans]APC50382.1 hypothetical protein BME96_19050 [Virgibacillus halodenitrificans]
MWYCTISFVSGKKENVIFPNVDEANQLFNAFPNAEEVNQPFNAKSNLVLCNNNGKRLLINFKNVEMVSEPKEYKEKTI